MKDKYSSDYDVTKISMDKRFVQCKKDAVLTLVSYLSVIVITWIVARTLCPKSIEDMTYFLGYPTWVTVSLLISIAFCIFVIIWAMKSKEINLSAKEDKEASK